MEEESKEALEDPRPQIIITPRGTCWADDDWVHVPRGYKDPGVSFFREHPEAPIWSWLAIKLYPTQLISNIQ